MSLARKLVFFGALVLFVASAGTLVISAIFSFLGSLVNEVSSSRGPTISGQSCSLVDATGRANLKVRCDSGDCDNDPSTVAGKIQAGSSVRKTGKTVGSSLPAVGEWVEVTYNGQTYYVAATKLSCQ